MDIPAVLMSIRPGTRWTLDGSDYSGLSWLDDSPKPTKSELDEAWPAVAHEREVARIRAEREQRYRAETDPMFMKVQRDEGGTLAEWKAAVEAIRADLPYPEAP